MAVSEDEQLRIMLLAERDQIHAELTELIDKDDTALRTARLFGMYVAYGNLLAQFGSDRLVWRYRAGIFLMSVCFTMWGSFSARGDWLWAIISLVGSVGAALIVERSRARLRRIEIGKPPEPGEFETGAGSR